MAVRQEILQSAHVMVVGCGALGNEVLKDLTLMGVGNITVVDFDTVEASNLTRSILFRHDDVGRSKVEVVSERLRELNPAVSVNAINGDIAHDVGLGVIGAVDVVMGCVDSRWARYMINRHCMRMGKPWVDGGITMSEGTVRVFRPVTDDSQGNCYACALSASDMEALRQRMPCSNTIRRMEEAGHAPTSIITASVVGASMVQEAVRLLCKQTTICGRMLCYDADTRSAQLVGFQAYDEDCPEHDSWLPVTDSVISVTMTVEEVLAWLTEMGLIPQIHLRDDVFVDYIIDRHTDARYAMMAPGRKVAEAMEADAMLRQRLTSDFYQNEYRTVDDSFPYKELTLAQLGIPAEDVLLTGGYVPVKIKGKE